MALRLFDALFTALFTGLFVAAGAALAVNYVQRRSDSRKEAREMRHDLLVRASSIHGPFYLATQHFYRRRKESGGDLEAQKIEDFDAAYLDFAAKAQSMEDELRAWFGDAAESVDRMHQIHDLLTIRYFTLKGEDSGNLRLVNSKGYEGKDHSGLEAAQLKNAGLVLKTYREAATRFGMAVRTDALTAPI